MKGFVISWYYPPINSAEGTVTHKLLNRSKFSYDVFTQKNTTSWSYGDTDSDIIADGVSVIAGSGESFEQWIASGLEFFKAHSDEYDFIMSRAMPAESHKLALKIKKRYPDLPWIASFGDPIYDNTYELSANTPNRLENIKIKIKNKSLKTVFKSGMRRAIKLPIITYRGLRSLIASAGKKRLERANKKIAIDTYNIADQIILNNEQQKNYMLAKSTSLQKHVDKIRIIPHSFETKYYPKFTNKNSTKITFSYIGDFYGPRKADELILALEKLKINNPKVSDKMVFNFYGNLSADNKLYIMDHDLTDLIKFKGSISYTESLKVMQGSDWLVAVDANLSTIVKEGIVFLSKLSDYLGAGRNIFAIAMLDSATADVVRKTESGIISSHCVDEIYLRLSQIIYKKYIPKKNQKEIEKFDSKNVAKIFDDDVLKLVQHSSELSKNLS